MATRATEEEVLQIIQTDLDEEGVTPYLSIANIMVTQVLADSGLEADVLKEIERWLTAHLIAITRTRQSRSEEVGGARVVYTGEFGAGLDSTTYGQMVKVLDTSGLMATVSGKRAATLYAVTSFE